MINKKYLFWAGICVLGVRLRHGSGLWRSEAGDEGARACHCIWLRWWLHGVGCNASDDGGQLAHLAGVHQHAQVVGVELRLEHGV